MLQVPLTRHTRTLDDLGILTRDQRTPLEQTLIAAGMPGPVVKRLTSEALIYWVDQAKQPGWEYDPSLSVARLIREAISGTTK